MRDAGTWSYEHAHAQPISGSAARRPHRTSAKRIGRMHCNDSDNIALALHKLLPQVTQMHSCEPSEQWLLVRMSAGSKDTLFTQLVKQKHT